MEEIYGLHSNLMSPDNLIIPAEYHSLFSSSDHHRFPVFGSEELMSAASAISEAASVTAVMHKGRWVDDDDDEEGASSVIKAKIASHPSYPKLLDAYIACQKVGAPPEIACLLDEIQRENGVSQPDAASTCFGADPELDEFMVRSAKTLAFTATSETYYDILVKYKTDLSRPFDEATTFLNKIETQLGNLCKGTFCVEEISLKPSSPGCISYTDKGFSSPLDEGSVSSDEEFSGGELDVLESQTRSEDRELKDKLLRKFGSHIGTLKEADKISLAELTGLDQKQINNWFINQRKRHWKPSENMQFDVLSSLSGHFYTDDD
ncbi:hypothetical protein RJ639_000342 [Escallonia herrerae]|uniref:Homeobox domain-containing protein n=1 Tax=Escallonia herrerae TaxID=1293975 RepID=A0AA88X871_9ASTE|nr:hypothetical protein RJ639_000342 [Escallonia herrerae]